jgi:ABC-type thiamin/hydroxymethylpyrimidine transport system permease subunit
VCSYLKSESVVVVFFTICISLSFYFTFLSVQAVDDALKKQLVIIAVYSLITGVTMLASLIIYLVIRKAFSPVENQLRSSEEPLENDKA